MSEIMLWLSGVDRDALSHCERERNKFVAMGGTVLTTAALATLAATFTIHEFLHAPLFFAVILGLGWGFAIMNLDRWLLVSIRRQDSTWKTIGMATPRVLLAVLIGAVIAHPLVLRVFDKEISAQATRDKAQSLSDGREEIREQYVAIPALDQEAKALRAELTDVDSGAAVVGAPEYQEADGELQQLEKKAANAQHAALCELDGRCGTDRRGAGPAYDEKKRVADELAAQVAAQRARVEAIRGRLLETESRQADRTRQSQQRNVAGVEAKLRQLKQDRKKALVELKDEYNGPIGLLDRVEALDNLTWERPSMLGIEILLFLFILAIDTMPAITKVLMSVGKPGLYETVQLELEAADVIGLKRQTEAHAEASRIEAELVVDEAETRQRLMKEVQDDLVKQAAEAMREAGEKFVALWRKAIVERVPRLVRGELTRSGLGNRGLGPGEPQGPGEPPDPGEPPSSGNGRNGGS